MVLLVAYVKVTTTMVTFVKLNNLIQKCFKIQQLTQKSSLNLLNVTQLLNNKFNLLYQATRYWFEGGIFHSKSNGIKNILTIIKSRNGNVLGGFTRIDCSGAYCGVIDKCYDSKAFLYN